jgi:hypothetical protein
MSGQFRAQEKRAMIDSTIPTAAPQLESHRKKAERHGVCTKTLDRWVEDGILPEPFRINGRKYWPVHVEPRRDGAVIANTTTTAA